MLCIPKDLLASTWRHLRAEFPREGVGLWAGRLGLVTRVIPLPNVDPKPHQGYEADPATLLRTLQGLEAAGLELLAIYHSHPTGPARPSLTDTAKAYWRVPYVIFALESSEVRAYRLPEEEEVRVEVED
ncbi:MULTISPECIES: Mov34/MPN/PAD-1 family protein [unclassified Meiothermus]|uniref:Mov34/MPN/PAD-1 family protein n=1 Tax=unclassified Meiothermus TaxID=370471 RepID=UPI000D7BCEE2|nr:MULTISPECIES: M67 family metallopeptidase [unclassified Meiothermus]PZA07926.1 metal-dependent protease of the PAD1/JAB1 superfamily [Meiothermus sp. Pnk-1]RYM36727.1 M67 family peptidase [Meiothermus sp. PNK-Is4]